MFWEVVDRRRVLVSLDIPADFLDWLRPRVRSAAVSQLDPFSDTTVEGESRNIWLEALTQAWSDLEAETRNRVERTARLPSAVEVRETIVNTLVDRDIRANSTASLLRELIAAFELAIQNDAVIRALGD
jgi:hypothetical protein